MFRRSLLILFLLLPFLLPAQVSHFVFAHHAAAPNKQVTTAGYSFGYRRICYTGSVGIGNGTDHQFRTMAQLEDKKLAQKIKSSQTVVPDPFPSGMFLEDCNSTYSVKEARLGFHVFLRRNDTLGRHPFSGLHAGVEVAFLRVHEEQTVKYKSLSDETRLMFSGTHDFFAIGAASHVGWQFALLHDHLYIDVRAVIPFYYPFMQEPNLNSPFAGTKYEAEVGIAWRFGKNKEEQKDEPTQKVRDKI